MKILFLVLGFSTGLLVSADSIAITNKPEATYLSTEQQSLCDRFRTNRAAMTTNEWIAVQDMLPWQLEISEDNVRKLLTVGPTISRDGIIELLGVPTQETTNQLIYVCGWANGERHSIIMRIESGNVYRSAYRITNP